MKTGIIFVTLLQSSHADVVEHGKGRSCAV
jgi:hypothetical protein